MELGGLGLTALRLKHLFKLDLLTANSNAALTCYDNLKIKLLKQFPYLSLS